MTHWKAVLQVARWEFARFVKVRQLVISLVVTLVSGGIGMGVTRLFDDDDTLPVTVPVIGAEALALAAGDTLVDAVSDRRFVLEPRAGLDEAGARAAVSARELDAVLLVRAADSAEVIARKNPSWDDALGRALTAHRQQARVAASGVPPATLGDIFAPVRFGVSHADPERDTSARGERMLTIALLALAFVGLMSGLGYAFAGITGEKQLRVTEQVLSAIRPQAWMDGKILGLAAVALVNAATTGLAVVAIFGLLLAVRGSFPSVPLPTNPLFLVAVPTFVLLGFLLWYAFLCALAATIDDPNSSQRSSFLFIPMLSLGIAGFAFAQPDRGISQFFSIFPLTSWTTLPVRMLLTEVPWWEPLLALALLLGTIWLVRRAAGRIFALGMLLYGKEPSLAELRRWLREA